jgi:nitrogenase subunit NifH
LTPKDITDRDLRRFLLLIPKSEAERWLIRRFFGQVLKVVETLITKGAEMKVYIKNMVCQGTRKFVLQEIKRLGFKIISFDSAEIEFENELLPSQVKTLERSMFKFGLVIFQESDLHNKSVDYTLNKPEIHAYVDEYFSDVEEIDINEAENISEPAELHPVL